MDHSEYLDSTALSNIKNIATESVTEALTRLGVGRIVDETVDDRIATFVNMIYYTYVPWKMVCENEMSEISVSIFTGPTVIRDFVLLASSLFWARYDGGQSKITELVHHLARATTFDSSNYSDSVLPSSVRKDLTEYDAVVKRLQGNRWFIVLLLITLMIELPKKSTTRHANSE